MELAPFSGDPHDHGVDQQAEAEIEDQSEVDVEAMVPGGKRERRQQEEIHKVAQDDGQQSLREVDEH